MSEVRPLNLCAGELVEVLSEAEILATLDERGTLDGLPFMPEMLAFCGQRLRVDKRADKACDTINYSGSRRMYRTVLLESARCTGAAHDLCQAACPLFWKEAWLRRVKVGEPIARRRVAPPAGQTTLGQGCDRAGLEMATRQATAAEDGQPRYRCQATDLLLATSPMKWWDPRQYLRDVRSGNVALTDVLCAAAFRTFLFVLHHGRGYRLKLALYARWQAWWGGTPFPYLRGELDKTPRATLDLKAGELVRVKSQTEILKTVNGRNRNHGLSFDAEMVRYCGQVFRVLSRVERVIEERTGKMIPLSTDCIVLDGVVCQSEYSDKRLFCPRKLYPFWREIWLERVTAEDVAASPRGAACMVATSGPCAGR